MKDMFKFDNIKNNALFKEGFEAGLQIAERLQKDDPKTYERVKKIFKNVTKGEK